ncbi:MAG: hypothetical protein ABWY55_00105 [Microbacterium sp.]
MADGPRSVSRCIHHVAMEILWKRRLAMAGGIASTADLHAMGLSDTDIRMLAGYRAIRRVRRGWYASPDADPLVPEDERDRVRLHWARHPSPGDRGAVHVEPARRQALACRG